MTKLTIYADCASYRNGRPDQVGGFCTLIVNEKNEVIHRILKAYKNTTNNYNELMGLLAGLDYVYNTHPDIKNIEVVSDSEYCVKGANERVFKWKANDWTNTSGPVKNLDLWKLMITYIVHANKTRKNLKFTWVRGHIGKTVTLEENRDVYFQELCDSYATRMLSEAVKSIT